MKKFMILALGLVLVGAGCAGGNKTEEVSTNPETTMAVPAPGHENVVEMIVNDSGGEIKVEIIPADGAPAEDGERVETSGNDLPVKKVTMKSGNFFFEPASIAAQAGQIVEVTFAENSGTHTFVIDEIGLKQSIKEGETLRFTAPANGGTYEFYCDIGNHRAQGMFGSLHVKEL